MIKAPGHQNEGGGGGGGHMKVGLHSILTACF